MTSMHRAQTLKQARTEYNKSSRSSISIEEQRRINRGAELLQRAESLKEAERRRKAAAQKRKEKEQRDAELRRKAKIGLATQCAGYSHTQKAMKKGMEAWVGIGGKCRMEEESVLDAAPKVERGQSCHPPHEEDPWDEDALEDAIAEVLKPAASAGIADAQDEQDGDTRARSEDTERDPWSQDDDDGVDIGSVLHDLTHPSPRHNSAPSQAQSSRKKRKQVSFDESLGPPTSPSRPSRPKMVPHSALLEDLDDFLTSDTQISRDLTPSPSPSRSPTPPLQVFSAPPFPTQFFSFSADDLEDLGLPSSTQYAKKPGADKKAMPPPPLSRSPHSNRLSSLFDLGMSSQELNSMIEDDIELSPPNETASKQKPLSAWKEQELQLLACDQFYEYDDL